METISGRELMYKEISGRLLEERKRLSLSQDEVRNHLGVSYSTMSRYENGHRLPDLEMSQKLCEVGYDIGYVLTGNRSQQKTIDTIVDKKPIKGLIKELDEYHEDVFADILMLYAHDIEYSLRMGGAVAGKDYDYRMLMELAHPYVMAYQQRYLATNEKLLELSIKF